MADQPRVRPPEEAPGWGFQGRIKETSAADCIIFADHLFFGPGVQWWRDKRKHHTAAPWKATNFGGLMTQALEWDEAGRPGSPQTATPATVAWQEVTAITRIASGDKLWFQESIRGEFRLSADDAEHARRVRAWRVAHNRGMWVSRYSWAVREPDVSLQQEAREVWIKAYEGAE